MTIKSCNGCRAYQEQQANLPTCGLGHELLFPVREVGGKLQRLSPGDIRPKTGVCEKPRTYSEFVSLSMARHQQTE